MNRTKSRQRPCNPNLYSSQVTNTYDAAYVIDRMTREFLITPSRIEFDRTKWNLYIPYVIGANNILTTANCCNNNRRFKNPLVDANLGTDPDILDIRSRRLDLPPLIARFRDENYMETQKVRAANGDINARWVVSSPLTGKPVWGNPDLPAHSPNTELMQRTEKAAEQQTANPSVNVAQLFNASMVAEQCNKIAQCNVRPVQPNVAQSKVVTGGKPVVAGGACCAKPTVGTPTVSSTGMPVPAVVVQNNNVPAVTHTNAVQAAGGIPFTPLSRNVIGQRQPFNPQSIVGGNIINGNIGGASVNITSPISVSDTLVETFPTPFSAIPVSQNLKTIPGYVPTLTDKQSVPYQYSDPLKLSNTQASIVDSINGAGNLTIENTTIMYEPLVAGTPQYEFPSFIVMSTPDQDGTFMNVTYLYYRDSVTQLAFSNTVKISVNILVNFVNNVRYALDQMAVTDRTNFILKMNNLMLSSNLVPQTNPPTADDVMVAFSVWVLSYPGFVGATRWDTGINGCPTNVPWVPVAAFDMTVFDIFGFYDTLNGIDGYSGVADPLFDEKFLMYADVVLQTVYINIDPRYHRWCSIAQGGGWYALMYQNSDPKKDDVYRHLYVIISLLCQKIWLQDIKINETLLVNTARDDRITYQEFVNNPHL